MNANLDSRSSRLWITYPWVVKEEKDFRYLPAELRSTSIDATYDSLRLTPNSHLWHRVVQRLLSVNVDAWCYVLTKEVVDQQVCMDELTAAVDKVPWHMGSDFPLAGLIYGINRENLPSTLRMHPCLSVEDPSWRTQVLELLHTRGPVINKQEVLERRYCWRIHTNYQGNPALTAVEVGTWGVGIPFWRFAVPGSCQPIRWGSGPAGGGPLSPVRMAGAQGVIRYKERNFIWFGAASKISQTESAYLVYSGALPEYLCFGPAESPFGPPGPMEILRTKMGRHSITESFN